MKKTILILFVTVAVIAAMGSLYCCANTLIRSQVKGSGRVVTRTIPLTPFSEIEASRAVKVVLTENNNMNQAIIEADDNLIDQVTVQVNDGKLSISISPAIQSISNNSVTVTVPTNGLISELDASSAASISGDITITGPKLKMEASSAAKIDIKANVTECSAEASNAAKIVAAVEAIQCEADASSAAKIQFSGKAQTCDVEVTSAAKFDAGDFIVAQYRVDVSSAGKAIVNCTDNLNASASSGGSILYSGSCQADRRMSSGGSIHRN